jgi:hypothetical protein
MFLDRVIDLSDPKGDRRKILQPIMSAGEMPLRKLLAPLLVAELLET